MNVKNVIGKHEKNIERKLRDKEFKILLKDLHDLYIDKSKNKNNER